ncbi:caspase family protein [Pontibacterium granulatum]|uniref:caspase family protein n=1 Tax=Pontibacterium granulatum TaxID=2036029 RepID=UPI00249B42DB|nr:caspase family protein [Pontibacterium granulatum]MDI3326583.1 caspase family protein [Pontibacterium granulatum]
MDKHFPMEVMSIESIKACRAEIKGKFAQLLRQLTKQDGSRDMEVTEKVADLFAWEGLLIYWIGQLDFQDSDGNIFVASQNAHQAANYLKSAEPATVKLLRTQMLGLALYAKSQVLGDIENYEKAIHTLTDVHAKLGEDSNLLSEGDRMSLRAYLAYWLGMLAIDKALATPVAVDSDSYAQLRFTAYRYLQQAYEEERDAETRLGYLLALKAQLGYASLHSNPDTAARIYSAEVLADHIERAAETAGNTQVKVWHLIDRAREAAFSIKSVGDAAYVQVSDLLARADQISTPLDLRHYLIDTANLRMELALQFADQETVESVMNELIQQAAYLGQLAQEQSLEAELWVSRYFLLIDIVGQAVVSFGDTGDAVTFFTELNNQGLSSAALNLSALYIEQGDYPSAIDTLTNISEDLSGMDRVVYRQNLSLARHLAGDLEGAIAVLSEENSPSDLAVAYQVSLLALNNQRNEALELIIKHAGAGYGALAQSLNRTALELYQSHNQGAKAGSILNTPVPLYSFINRLVFNSDIEKNGFPYFQGAATRTAETGATLVTGIKNDDWATVSQLSTNGQTVALANGNQITLWGSDNGLPFRRINSSDRVQYMDFLHNDQHLLVQSADNLLTLWALETGEALYTLPVSSNIWKAYAINRAEGSLYFSNPYAQLVEMDSHDPATTRIVEAANGSVIFTTDDRGKRLFFVSDGQLFVYDLERQAIQHRVPVSGYVRELTYIPGVQQLLTLTDKGFNPNGEVDKDKYRLAVWSLNDGLHEVTHFAFANAVHVVGAVEEGRKVLLTSRDGDIRLDMQALHLQPLADAKDSRFVALSESRDRAIVSDKNSRNLRVVDYPSSKLVNRLKQPTSDPGLVFYDEERERLMVSSSYDRLHIWDMSTGQEIVREKHYPRVNPGYINGQLITLIDEVQRYSPEKNRWGHFEQGTLMTQPLSLPKEIVDSNVRADLQVFESGEQLYFTAWDQYLGDTRQRRIWRSNVDMTEVKLLPWTLEGERIGAIDSNAQRLVTASAKKVLIRSLQDGVIRAEISIASEYGGFDDLELTWVDVENQTIWIGVDNHLVGYDFEGNPKVRFSDEFGRLIAVAGHPTASHFIAAYEISGSTLLRKVDRQSGSVVRSDVLFDRIAKGINLSSKGRYLMVSTEVGSIEFWSLTKNEAMFSMYLLPDKTWAVIDQQGRFDTNDLSNIDFLAWRLPQEPLRSYPVDIFLRNFYEPRLIPRLLNDAPFSPIPDLRRINRWQPEVEITQVEDDGKGKLNVTVELNKGAWPDSAQTKAYDLRLFRNGQQVDVYPQDHGEIDLSDSGSRVIVFKQVALPNLQKGQAVEFSAMAFNAAGVKSQTAYAQYVPEKTGIIQPPRAFILNVGIDHYTNPAWNLAFAGNDARLLATTLADNVKASGDYASIGRKMLVTQPGQFIDKAQIRAAIQRLANAGSSDSTDPEGFAQSTPNDTVIMTWSGHGYVDQAGEFYLLTSTMGPDSVDMQDNLQGAVSATELSRWIEGIDVHRFILIIDACHSAAAVDSGAFKPGPMGSKGFGQLAWYKGMQILTASQANDVALESSLLEHGLLTYALVNDGLVNEQADFLPQDGVLTASEWLKFGQQRVPQIYRLLKAGNSSALKLSRGAKRKNRPRVEKVQMPGLFDFYRGDQTMQLHTNH